MSLAGRDWKGNAKLWGAIPHSASISFCFLPILPHLPALFGLPMSVWTCPVSLNSFLSFFSFAYSSIFLSCTAGTSFFPDRLLAVCIGLGRGAWLAQCSGRCLSPSEPVSQHCPGDWSLSVVPRPWGGASKLWVQPVLLSQKRFPSWAGQGCGLKLSRSELGEQRSLVLRLPRSTVITGMPRSD